MKSIIENRINEIGIELEETFTPVGNYVPCLQVDKLIYTSGILPIKDGIPIYQGKVGKDISMAEVEVCTRQIIVNVFTILKKYLHSLDEIKRCIKLSGYVASADDFYEHPKVLNHASNLLIEILGESGRHVRTVIGVPSLPLNVPVVIDFIFERI